MLWHQENKSFIFLPSLLVLVLLGVMLAEQIISKFFLTNMEVLLAAY
jgi:uncharacterized membrane protein